MTTVPQIPVVSVVGKGDSGKTTFLEKLIAELAGRGVKVATVKHHVHDYDIDVPGKDSWRHAQAGAFATMVSSPTKFSVIQSVETEMPLDAIAAIAHNTGADLLITEGYKIEGRNRIEISRLDRSDSLVCDPAELLAVVTDNPAHAECGVPVFDLDDGISAVATFVIERFLADGAGAGRSAASPAGGAGAREGASGAFEAPRAPAEDCPSAGSPGPGDSATGGARDGD